MEDKDIRVGDLLNLRVRVCRPISAFSDRLYLQAEIPLKSLDSTLELTRDIIPALSPVTPENGTKNTEPAPKYDPCRKFRKGDIVEPAEINGRLPQELKKCLRYEVIVGEGKMANPLYVAVKPLLPGNYELLSDIRVNVAFLKLVTPEEEPDPYKVNHIEDLELFEVYHYEMGEDTIAEEGKLYKIVRTIYRYGKRQLDRTEAQAKAEAEAECARLNAEYRKERS